LREKSENLLSIYLNINAMALDCRQ